MICEVLRYWHEGDRGADYAKRAQEGAKPVWERHLRLQQAAEELLEALHEKPEPSADEEQLREALTRCARIWKHYARKYAIEFDLSKKGRGHPRSVTLTYETARRLLYGAGLSDRVAQRLLIGRHR